MTTTTATTTAASVYQQLRGHLTDLKLADAADALPAVLDQAQAEGWTLTQALEHLLRVEVTATADLPAGVVNLLSGDAAELTPQFASHMEIQGLAFLRDEPQQRTELERAAADNMKRCVASHGPLLALERVLDFVEYKTVWHPIGS